MCRVFSIFILSLGLLMSAACGSGKKSLTSDKSNEKISGPSNGAYCKFARKSVEEGTSPGQIITAEEADSTQEPIDQVQKIAPSEIKADLKLVMETFREYLQAVQKADGDSSKVDLAIVTRLIADETVAASARITKYNVEVCGVVMPAVPADVGSSAPGKAKSTERRRQGKIDGHEWTLEVGYDQPLDACVVLKIDGREVSAREGKCEQLDNIEKLLVLEFGIDEGSSLGYVIGLAASDARKIRVEYTDNTEEIVQDLNGVFVALFPRSIGLKSVEVITENGQRQSCIVTNKRPARAC